MSSYLFVWLVGCFQNCAGSFTYFLAKSNLDYLMNEKSLQTSTFIALHISPFLECTRFLIWPKVRNPNVCVISLIGLFCFFVFQLSSLASTCLWASNWGLHSYQMHIKAWNQLHIFICACIAFHSIIQLLWAAENVEICIKLLKFANS